MKLYGSEDRGVRKWPAVFYVQHQAVHKIRSVLTSVAFLFDMITNKNNHHGTLDHFCDIWINIFNIFWYFDPRSGCPTPWVPIFQQNVICWRLSSNWFCWMRKSKFGVYHSTNHSTTGKSPAELMFGRRIRNKLPHVPLYRLDDEETRENDMVHKEKGKEYADGKR